MPIYEYQCRECSKKFEIAGSFESLLSNHPVCPNCRSKKVKKIFSVPFIRFNGKGFYVTDKNNK